LLPGTATLRPPQDPVSAMAAVPLKRTGLDPPISL
jgi:hypothetical protein